MDAFPFPRVEVERVLSRKRSFLGMFPGNWWCILACFIFPVGEPNDNVRLLPVPSTSPTVPPRRSISISKQIETKTFFLKATHFPTYFDKGVGGLLEPRSYSFLHYSVQLGPPTRLSHFSFKILEGISNFPSRRSPFGKFWNPTPGESPSKLKIF